MFTIGLEGLMLFGASASALGLAVTGSPMLALLAGMAATAGGSGAGIRHRFCPCQPDCDGHWLQFVGHRRDITDSATMAKRCAGKRLNAVRLDVKTALAVDIPVVGRALFSQSPVFYLAVLVGIALWVLFRFTRAGLLLRAVGENALSTDAAGHPVLRLRFFAVLFTGLMAGLGGAICASSPRAGSSSTI